MMIDDFKKCSDELSKGSEPACDIARDAAGLQAKADELQRELGTDEEMKDEVDAAGAVAIAVSSVAAHDGLKQILGVLKFTRIASIDNTPTGWLLLMELLQF